ncbi:MAG: diaminopimelate epimerase [Oscillospiraceae bacterium]|jgi:diaminopimelate epimerase|nr:diaminopimelate epimerase [Oscillospiraceae bacterium]
MTFTKMHGAGNDYIYVNCFEESVPDPAALAVKVSHRHFGVGADGLVLIMPSDAADFRMRIFNADGSEAQMCGNASRCVAKYVYGNGMTAKNPIALETRAGIKTLRMHIEGGKVRAVTVDMGAPVTGCVNQPLPGTAYRYTDVSMGNPHCVIFVDEVDSLPLWRIGPPIENHQAFPERANVEFVRVIDRNTIQMRVWERGSGETLACGTGTCASVAACVLNGYCDKDSDILAHLRGGDLVIRWDSATNTILKTGPAEFICKGELL